MYYIHNLRSQISEWRNRLYKGNYQTITTEFILFWKKIHQQPILNSILSVQLNKYLLDAVKRKELFDQIQSESEWFQHEDSEMRTGILYQMNLQAIEEKDIPGLAISIGGFEGDRDFPSCRDKFMELMIEPIVNFINDQIEEGHLPLYLLEKYKKRVEWFLHKELRQKFDSYQGKQEDVFDDDLRLYLFDQGIDNPFSRPRNSTGSPDIVGEIDTNDPLVLEIKYYNGTTYKKKRVIEGFAQIVKYTELYNKPIGYLVVFNLTQTEIVIESEDNTKQFPPRINLNNRDYYIVTVNINYDEKASELGKLQVEKITKTELTAINLDE